jgi:hypothetical protein
VVGISNTGVVEFVIVEGTTEVEFVTEGTGGVEVVATAVLSLFSGVVIVTLVTFSTVGFGTGYLAIA